MYATYIAVTVLTIVANTASATADLRGIRFVLANAAEVGVPRTWLPMLAALKAAGALGLLVGLLGVPVLGIAAAAGLTLFFTGALITHARAKVFHNIAFPGAYWLLAAGSLTLAVATH